MMSHALPGQKLQSISFDYKWAKEHRTCQRNKTKHLVITVYFAYMMEYHISRVILAKMTKFKVILARSGCANPN